MKDTLCIIMGITDIIAGLLVFIAFGTNILGIIFGSIMIIKGCISFI